MWKMRVVFVAFGLMLGLVGNSQVYGDVGIAKRKVVTDCERKIAASGSEGLIFITIKVNRDGKVTAATLEMGRSTVSNTILVREALVRAKKMLFEADYTAPTFHEGIVEFKVTKSGEGKAVKRKNILPEE